jgi:hypothetical protein
MELIGINQLLVCTNDVSLMEQDVSSKNRIAAWKPH